WYFNSQPLTVPQGQNKHLVLDPVSSQQAGNYSCAIETGKTSREKTLTVLSNREKHKGAVAAAVVRAVLLVIAPLLVFFWIRRKRTSGQTPATEAAVNTEQLNADPEYENISAPPPEQDDLDDLRCGRVHFSKTQTDPLDSIVQPHQSEPEDHAA
ncbi:hypothetical protein INR49_028699, partial [Caranx melampygus]